MNCVLGWPSISMDLKLKHLCACACACKLMIEPSCREDVRVYFIVLVLWKYDSSYTAMVARLFTNDQGEG